MEAKKQNTTQKREENLKKTFWKLAHARQAMAHVLASCDFYLKHIASDKHPMHVPLLCSICVMYARPFTDNAGVGMISRKFTKHSDGRLQKTHDMLWRSRKEFYAHSDATLTAKMTSGEIQPIQPIDVIISRQTTRDGMRFSFGYQLHELRLRGIVVSDVRDLCRELDKLLQHEIRVTLDQLFTRRIPELMRVFDETHEDQLSCRIDFPANEIKRDRRPA
jgi:hypothetical protein